MLGALVPFVRKPSVAVSSSVLPSGKYCQGRWGQEKAYRGAEAAPACRGGRQPACGGPRSKAGGRGPAAKRGELFLRELGRGVKTFSERGRI